MDMRNILIEKLDHEMSEFRSSYSDKSIKETYNDWYVIGFKEAYYDFLSSDFLESRFNEKELAWMGTLEKPIDFLYDRWTDADGETSYNWDFMVDFVRGVYYDEKHREKQGLHNDIKALGIKVVEKATDEYFDNFDFRAHVSDQTVVFSDLLPKHFDENINEQFNAFFKNKLLVKSCDYGCNTYPRGVSKEVAPGNGQTYRQEVWNFIEAVEQMFECKCTYYDEVNGFEFVVAFGEGDNKGCYVFGAGNNGQEFCQSIYFDNTKQIQDEAFVKALTTIDKTFYTLLEEYELCVVPKEQEASLEDKIEQAKTQGLGSESVENKLDKKDLER